MRGGAFFRKPSNTLVVFDYFSDMQSFDVIVIGGGPAGMMAAGHAAQRGRRILLLEKNHQLGKKLRITGGGRCNITNAEYDNRTLLVNYGEAEKFLHSTFSRFAVQQTFDFFTQRGLPLVVEPRQRAFPHTLCATDVARVLEGYLADYDVEVKTGVSVTRLLVHGKRIQGVETSRGRFTADAVILATGGLSHPATGSTGDGFRWLRDIGHTVVDPNPDVVPLRVKETWVRQLSGRSIKCMTITFFKPGTRKGKEAGRKALDRTGELLFTHFGLSGPLILNCAHEVKALLKSGPVPATIDGYPGEEMPAVDQQVLAYFARHPNKMLRNCLKPLCPPGMTTAYQEHLQAGVLDKKVCQVTQAERKEFVRLLKGLPLTITKTMGYDWAVVSDGGVSLREVDTRTMASRLIPNLYMVGDLLHISRPSGGYSLQLCWTTGWVAGENV